MLSAGRKERQDEENYSRQTAGEKKHEDKKKQTTGFPPQNFFLGPDLPSCVWVAIFSTWYQTYPELAAEVYPQLQLSFRLNTFT